MNWLVRIFRKLRRKIRWHYVDTLARLGVGSAEILRQGRRPAYGKAEPELLTVTQGDESFDVHDALHGAYSSFEQSQSIPHALWVETAEGSETIRYYPAGLSSESNTLALLF